MPCAPPLQPPGVAISLAERKFLPSLITVCSNMVVGTGECEPGDSDETMDVCRRLCRARGGWMVAFARLRAAGGPTGGERNDHVRAVPRFPAARFGAASGASRQAARRPRPVGSREGEPRTAQGLLR